MTNRWILHAVFLLCFSTTALSIDYKQLQSQQSTRIQTCKKLLKHLNGKVNFSFGMDFKFPMEMTHPSQMEKSYTVFVTKVMLQNVFLVFRNNFSSTGWNETIVKRLLDKLHRQTEFLETILEEKQDKILTWRASVTTLRLKNYYWKVQRYLKDKKYNSYAWMVVRTEIFKNFFIILRLTRNFQN